MQISVRFLPPINKSVGKDSLQMDVPAGTTVGQVLRRLATDIPQWETNWKNVMYIVNSGRATPETVLNEGDTIAFFMTLGGG